MFGDSGFGVFHLPFEVSQFLVEDCESRATRHVEGIEKVGDPLYRGCDDFDVLAVRPVLVEVSGGSEEGEGRRFTISKSKTTKT